MSAIIPKSSPGSLPAVQFGTQSPTGFEFDVKPIADTSAAPLPCIRLRCSIVFNGHVKVTSYEHKSPEPTAFALSSAMLSAATHTGTVDLYSLMGYSRDLSKSAWWCTIDKVKDIRRCLRSNGIQGYTKVNDTIEILVKPDEYGRIHDFRIPLGRVITPALAPPAKKRKVT